MSTADRPSAVSPRPASANFFSTDRVSSPDTGRVTTRGFASPATDAAVRHFGAQYRDDGRFAS